MPSISTAEHIKVPLTLTIDPSQSFGWKTILFNCNCHTFDTVIETLMEATKCSRTIAEHMAYVADKFGSVEVCKGTKEYCESVADVLGKAGLLARATN